MKPLTLKLSRRSDGRYAKQIDGRYYTWPDEAAAKAAVVELIRQRLAGDGDARPEKPQGPVTLRDIANRFRAARMSTVKPGTWSDYQTAIDQFLAATGKLRPADSLRPEDFAAVRKRWASELGPWKLDNRVQSIRTMFRWAHRVGRLISAEPWYGDQFSKTTAAEKRASKRAHAAEHGDRPLTPAEVRKVLDAATGPLRAFVLLALNCGMYAADIAQLVPADIRREGKLTLVDNDRGKTGVIRKAILWPETVAAMAGLRSGGGRLFATVHGNPWVQGETDSIGLLFRRLLTDLEIKRAGVGFGSLKHTHVSAVGRHPDLNAARLVRGHAFGGIEGHYDFPDIERIKAVTDLARQRLLVTKTPRRASPARRRAAG